METNVTEKSPNTRKNKNRTAKEGDDNSKTKIGSYVDVEEDFEDAAKYLATNQHETGLGVDLAKVNFN